MLKSVKIFLDDIKIQHTIFALPFAVMSAFLAAEGLPLIQTLFWIIFAMIGARSAAMAFNRLVDAKYDKENQRTKNRALPAGNIGRFEYISFMAASVLLFEFCCYMLNPLALKLSPIALFIVFIYSLTKRFTIYSHFVLGLALGLAPVGAWVAVREEIAIPALILMGGVIFWLAGLDIIYSCQDAEFDKEAGLYSFPGKFGLNKALRLSAVFHSIMVFFLFTLYFSFHLLGTIYLIGLALVTLLLIYEHSLVAPDDLSKVNVAFFNMNGVISILLALFTIADLMI